MLSRRLAVGLRASNARAFSVARTVLNEKKDAEVNVFEHTPALTPVELTSGAPVELSTNRVVRIYQQSKPATQSGNYGKFSPLPDPPTKAHERGVLSGGPQDFFLTAAPY